MNKATLQALPAYITTVKTAQSKSCAHSSKFNPRSLEHNWYPTYGHTYTDLSAWSDHHQVHPQCPLWIDGDIREEVSVLDDRISDGEDGSGDGEDDSGDEEDGEDDEYSAPGVGHQQPGIQSRRSARLVKAQAKSSQKEEELEAAEIAAEMRAMQLQEQREVRQAFVDDVGNMSFESSTTVPEGKALARYPDFAIVHLSAEQLDDPGAEDIAAQDHYRHRAGWQIYHQCCSLLAEIKPAPPHTATDEKFNRARASYLASATWQVLEDCCIYFLRYPQACSLIAFVAAGPWWKWAQVSSAELPKWDFHNHRADDEAKVTALMAKFSDTLEICTTQSDEVLDKLWKEYILVKDDEKE